MSQCVFNENTIRRFIIFEFEYLKKKLTKLKKTYYMCKILVLVKMNTKILEIKFYYHSNLK